MLQEAFQGASYVIIEGVTDPSTHFFAKWTRQHSKAWLEEKRLR
jgi:hypothetical protein